ncbi:MAG TPA: sigma-70 family RNA polymerase sigma factor [Solirubrobacteraceae bacterium]|nr:sigma-70 family RNA polymerase sigma factor [Solirubrobacteraceae bacterium]
MNDDPGFARFLTEMARTPLLTATEERRLALRVERGDLAAKERMIAANLRLVVHVARAYQRSADNALAFSDLVQEGTFGLVRAVEKFDPRRGLRFSTYATIWIRQSIARAITNKARPIRLPASVEQRLLALRRTERALAAELGRDATAAECAAELGWEEDEVDQVRRAEHDVISLHQSVGPESETELGELLPDDAPSPFEQVESILLTEEVRSALDALAPRERALLELRYGFGALPPMTRSEAARRLGMRRREAVRIEEVALRRMRANPGELSTAA